jgi:hypothetical protein
MATDAETTFLSWERSSALRWVAQFRIEEFIAYLFFIPCLAITMRANFFLWLQDYGMGQKIVAGIWRMAVITLFLPVIPYLSRKSAGSRGFMMLRNAFPFVVCLTIYANLHDTIHFVNPHDVQNWFLKADIWLFGVEPTLWAQRFYHPWLTELFSFCYEFYLPLIVLLPAILYFQARNKEARQALVGIVLCFYWGYFLYIAFPAVPPRIWIADQFTHDLEGGFLAAAQRAMVNVTESSSRAAFPSLHAAITLLSLIYSFKFVRKLFWFLLPMAIGLLLATIYLRHHYIVDLFAGIPLALFAYKFSPAWERAWENWRSNLMLRGGAVREGL